MAAKPILDILVEGADLDEVRRRIVPILTDQGYEYLSRPTRGDDVPLSFDASTTAASRRRNAMGSREAGRSAGF